MVLPSAYNSDRIYIMEQ